MSKTAHGFNGRVIAPMVGMQSNGFEWRKDRHVWTECVCLSRFRDDGELRDHLREKNVPLSELYGWSSK